VLDSRHRKCWKKTRKENNMTAPTRTPRIARPEPELLRALEQHTRLLRDYANRAFNEGDDAYLGEVAGKLRVLVYEEGRNRPLLLALMDTLRIDVPIVLDGPGGPFPPITLREYLDGTAFAIRISSGELVDRSYKQVIGLWAQQHGASHEDWTLSEEFMTARDSELFLGGQPALAAVLRCVTNTVLYAADEFFRRLAATFPTGA
jgi:hypothetical protein